MQLSLICPRSRSQESVPYAHIVAKTLLGKRRHNAQFELAPQPSDLIWQNLNMSNAARGKNKFFGSILLILLCGFYIIPLVAVSLLANLAALYVPLVPFLALALSCDGGELTRDAVRAQVGLRRVHRPLDQQLPVALLGLHRCGSPSPAPSTSLSNSSLTLSALLAGVVPPVLTLILQMILPMIIRSVHSRLSSCAGLNS